MKLSDHILKKLATRLKTVENSMWKTGVSNEEREAIIAVKLELGRVIQMVKEVQKKSEEEDEEFEEESADPAQPAAEVPTRKSRPRSWSPPR